MRLCVSVAVCFCLVPQFLGATIRHYHFTLEGVKEVERVCVYSTMLLHSLLQYNYYLSFNFLCFVVEIVRRIFLMSIHMNK